MMDSISFWSKKMKIETKISGKMENCLNSIKDAVEDIWQNPKLTHYTNHDTRHSEIIIQILNRMLETVPDDLLTEDESFILLASAYIHDIGMQSAVHSGLPNKTDYTLDEKEVIRSKHHESSKKMIIESCSSGISLGLEQCEEYIPYISTVVKSHSSKVKIDDVRDTSFQGETLKLKLLSALLKLADELDRDHRRVNLNALKLWDIPPESKFHWWSHHYTQSIHIENGKIKIFFRFPKEYEKENKLPDIFIKKTKRSISDQLHEVYEILWENGIKLFLDDNVEIGYLDGTLEIIPPDLNIYLENIIKNSSNSENADIRTGIYWYVDGVAYSENEEITECVAKITEHLMSEEYTKALEEVENGLLLTLEPLERAELLVLGGNIYYMLTDMNNSKKYYEMALKICNRENIKLIYENDVNQIYAVCLNNIGIIYRWKGELEKAMEYHKEAFDIYQKLKDEIGLANTLNSIGLVYTDKTDFDKALEYHNNSLEIYKEKGYKLGVSANLINISIIYQYKGDLEVSINLLKEALIISNDIKDKYGKAAALNNLGMAYKNLGYLESALSYSKKSLDIFKQNKDKRGEAAQLDNIVGIYYFKKDFDKGLEYSKKSLKIHIETGNKKGQSISLSNIGLSYAYKGDLDKAIDYFKKSLKLSKECNYLIGELNQLGNIGTIYLNKGDYDKSLVNYQKILKNHKKMGAKKLTALDYLNISVLYKNQGNKSKYNEYYDKAIKMDEEYIKRLTNNQFN